VSAKEAQNGVFEINSDLFNYAKCIGEELFVNLHLNRRHNYFTFVADRQNDAVFPYQFSDQTVSVFHIPKGWDVASVPANSKLWYDNFGYDIEYEVKPDQVIMRKSFYLKALRIPTTQHQVWNEVIERLSSAYRQSVLLRKNFPKQKN
jgi:hypothetical protein